MVWDDASVGVVKAERNEIDKQVVVGSVQTVSRENRLEQLPQDFDFIVTDEAHHGAAATYRRIYEYLGIMQRDNEGDIWSDALHLGVTATPQRTDKIGLSDIFDKVVFHRSIRDFIPDYLCDLRCVRIMTHVSVDGVETWAGDLRTEQLSARRHVTIMEDIFAKYRKWLKENGAQTVLIQLSILDLAAIHGNICC